MRLRALVLSAIALLVNCNNNKEVIDQAAEFEKRACACKDAACIDVVVKDVKTWFDKYKNRQGTDSDVNAVEKHFNAMGDCMAKTGMSEESAKTLVQIGEEAEKL
jgi:hypothetical protein